LPELIDNIKFLQHANTRGADGDSDEWFRDDEITSSLCGFQPLSDKERKKLGVVEMVLYNMASLLAGFAAGYDVRISNLSPQPVAHPTLQSLAQLHPNGEPLKAHNSPFYKSVYPHERDIMNVGNPHLNRLYGLETYHGPTKQKIR